MPSFAMTVPYLRTSPVHIPRRDLVLGRADSLFLRVTVVDSDSVCAQGIDLSGGLGGPVLQMLVWPDQHHRGAWDYGAYWHWPQCPQTVLMGRHGRDQRCARCVRHQLPHGDDGGLAATLRLRAPARLRRRRRHGPAGRGPVCISGTRCRARSIP